jgi:hypothetical protein
MSVNSRDSAALGGVTVVPEVIAYINKRDCDFRICTSCGGPILLPVRVKPPKKTDLLLKAGGHTIYVSIHQARFLDSIQTDMIPFFEENEHPGLNSDEF